MEITSAYPALNAIEAAKSTNTVQGAVGMKMLSKTLDTTEQMNTSMIKMMEHSVTPYLGGNIDESV